MNRLWFLKLKYRFTHTYSWPSHCWGHLTWQTASGWKDSIWLTVLRLQSPVVGEWEQFYGSQVGGGHSHCSCSQEAEDGCYSVLLSAFAFSFGLKSGSHVQGGASILWKCLQRNALSCTFQVIPNPIKLTGILTPRLWSLLMVLGSKGMKMYESVKPCTQMSIAAIFRLTKIRNPLRFPPTGSTDSTIWYSHTVGHYWVMKRMKYQLRKYMDEPWKHYAKEQG